MDTLLAITFRDLLNPEFYINNGGLWVMLFIVFAETGLMFGFFLPGDSLLFVAGIYSQKLIDKLIPGGTGSDFFGQCPAADPGLIQHESGDINDGPKHRG